MNAFVEAARANVRAMEVTFMVWQLTVSLCGWWLKVGG